MNEQDMKLKVAELSQGKIIMLNVMNVNHNPHTYMIGAKHVVHASKNWGGSLTVAAIEDAERYGIHCCQPGCNLAYKNHTSDRVMFIQLTCNIDKDESAAIMVVITEEIFKPEKIDGFAIVDTPQKFRITESTITLSKEFIQGLRRSYDKAVINKTSSFTYEGKEFVTDYAKYMLEHYEPMFGVQPSKKPV